MDKNGHGEKLTRKQEQAIAALLSTPTIEAAAVQAGVGVTTLRRWLKDEPAFLAEYRLARRQVVEAAVGRLQQATNQAVSTLTRALDARKTSDQIRAALGILTQAFRGVEILDVVERLEMLEKIQEAKPPS